MFKASFYSKLRAGKVRCDLCPHYCVLSEGNNGKCGTRFEKDGILYTSTYGKLSSISIDPVEKKPLYHFYPSSKILSIGSYGCTMQCNHCQNSSISQCRSNSIPVGVITHLDAMMNEIERHDLDLLAFTYNEPVVFYDYMLDIAISAGKKNIKTAMVSNGYINKEPLHHLLNHVSAFNIDLKAFNEDFYRTYTGAGLEPVLNSIRQIGASGKHLEITFLVIPGLNDQIEDFERMISFIVNEVGKDTVLHITRYFPHNQMDIPPTPIETIRSLREFASQKLNYVYAGNINNTIDSNTNCPKCNYTLIKRISYFSEINGIEAGRCKQCGYEIAGTFE